jgi:uncharacterized membrane protein
MSKPTIHTGRIEAFSDGVIAIIITVMVFDLKIPEHIQSQNLALGLQALLPKISSYVLSFFMLAVMWINHHQLFHQIRHANRRLLWYNLHLLFWMSFVPFATNVLGANTLEPVATSIYGSIFMCNALSFALLRAFVVKEKLLHDAVNIDRHTRIQKKNRLAIAAYACSAVIGWIAPPLPFLFFLFVPLMYVIPEHIFHHQE